MPNFKSLRRLALLCGALLLVNAPVTWAQDGAANDTAPPPTYPAPAKTPEAAGERFYQFLSAGNVRKDESARVAFDWTMSTRYLDAISRAQMLAISGRPQSNGGPEQLLAMLAQQKDEPQFEGKVIGTEGEQTLVEVAPAPAKKRAVAVIAEDGGFRVDLKATYGRWNDVSGEALDIDWYKFTGIEAPTLAGSAAFQRERENARRVSCQTNLKQAMLGILQYSQDYNETYPPARKWVDEIMPYVKSEQIFRCPALPAGSNYGYALNQNLDGIQLAKMNNVAQTVAIYETDDLTRNAFGVADERAYRHLGGSNLAFADGHVKWFAKDNEPKESVSFKP